MKIALVDGSSVASGMRMFHVPQSHVRSDLYIIAIPNTLYQHKPSI